MAAGCQIYMYLILFFVTTGVTIPLPRVPGGKSGGVEIEEGAAAAGTAGALKHAEIDKTAYQQATNMYWQKIRESTALGAPDPEFSDEYPDDDMMVHDLDEEHINFRQECNFFPVP
jgi:hypothetical protein